MNYENMNDSTKVPNINGLYTEYYENKFSLRKNILKIKTYYKNNKIDGEFQEYDSNGQLIYETKYKNDINIGPEIRFNKTKMLDHVKSFFGHSEDNERVFYNTTSESIINKLTRCAF